MILGVDFFGKNNIKIEFNNKNNNLILMNHNIKLNDLETLEYMTITIPEKKTATNHLDTINSNYFSRVNIENPISFTKSEIPIQKNGIHILIPYNIPLHMQDLQNNEIQELLIKNIVAAHGATL
ncbi:hypothetical protein DMUE_0782 [Dictyocoela muelleri]|nr:hypothetical protein DMUE_0782 [Dictyocoela muelleri]